MAKLRIAGAVIVLKLSGFKRIPLGGNDFTFGCGN
jgi:hypothetical protein